MHKCGWVMTVGLLLIAAVPCNDARAQAAPAQTPAQPKSATGAAPAHKPATTSPYDRALLRPALLTAKAPATYQVKFTTTKGDFVITVTRAWAPLGADRFYNLVKNGFYDNDRFFRVVSGFMVQFGINGDPKLSSVWREARIKDDPVKQSNSRGFITFATAGPNTRTTQVFINFADNSALDNQGFAPFGQVVSGMNVVDGLYADYGEGGSGGRGPAQDRIQREGNTYLTAEFAKMDYIKKATIVK